jgi:hypothetical protein
MDKSGVFEELERFFGLCALICTGILVPWSISVLVFGDQIFAIHSGLFQLQRADFELVNYTLIGCFKLAVLTLFVAPWLALRLGRRRLEAGPANAAG